MILSPECLHAVSCMPAKNFANSSRLAERSCILPLMTAACARQAEAAKRKLPQKLEVLDIPQDDAWFRDSGPSARSAASSRIQLP